MLQVLRRNIKKTRSCWITTAMLFHYPPLYPIECHLPSSNHATTSSRPLSAFTTSCTLPFSSASAYSSIYKAAYSFSTLSSFLPPSAGSDNSPATIQAEEAAMLLERLGRDEDLGRCAIASISPKPRRRLLRLLLQEIQREDYCPPSTLATTRSRADEVFDALDINRDGQVTQREFRTWYNLHFKPSCAPDLPSQQQQLQQHQQTQSFLSSSQSSQLVTPGISYSLDPRLSAPTDDWQNEQYSDSLQEPLHRERSFSQQPVTDIYNRVRHPAVPLKETLTITGPIIQHHTTDDDDDEQLPLTKKQVFLVLLRSSIPYIGFGFIDNCLMLLFGEIIDKHLGVVLNLTTLGAAGYGNMISCATGVVTGGFIERVSYRLGIPRPNLSSEQAESKFAKNLHLVGSVVGICIGCLAGMFPLLLLSTKSPTKSSDSQAAKKQ